MDARLSLGDESKELDIHQLEKSVEFLNKLKAMPEREKIAEQKNEALDILNAVSKDKNITSEQIERLSILLDEIKGNE